MKTYQVASPPNASGIYMLRLKTTDQKYIGQSRNLHRRWLEWKSVFAQGLGVKSKLMRDLAASTDPHDWEFVVLKEVLPCQVHALDRLEQHAIKCAAANPVGVLNKIVRNRTGALLASCAKTEVRDTSGALLTRRAAAGLLGLTPQTVKKKLHALRMKGFNRVKICGENKSISPY